VRLSQRSLGAHDSLRHRGFWNQESPRDFFGGQSTQQAQGEGHAHFSGEYGMAGHEDQAQEIVFNIFRGWDIHI
jgi:hypothetical protein